jgi:uncharacterized protein YegL
VKGIKMTLVEDQNQGAPAVLPFYVVCDESISMSGDSIDAVNLGIKELLRAIAGDPIVDEKARVGIITFNDQARELLPLTQLSSSPPISGCVASGSTSYAAVFELLKTKIEADVTHLKDVEGYRCHRPMVFFMSDGAPNPEDWRTPLAALTDPNFRYRPNIVSFGVAGAEASVIKEVSTPLTVGGGKKDSFAFLAEEGTNPGPALKEIMKFITATIVTSARQEQPVATMPNLEAFGVLHIDSV